MHVGVNYGVRIIQLNFVGNSGKISPSTVILLLLFVIVMYNEFQAFKISPMICLPLVFNPTILRSLVYMGDEAFTD